MVFCIRLLIVLWCSAKTRKINLMVHYVLCLLRSEAEILNSKKVYDCKEANHAVKIKNLLQYSPVYAESTATNKFFYLNTNGMQKNGLQKLTKTNLITIKGFNSLRKALFGTSSTVNTEIPQGHPTSIFGKYLFGRRFEI